MSYLFSGLMVYTNKVYVHEIVLLVMSLVAIGNGMGAGCK